MGLANGQEEELVIYFGSFLITTYTNFYIGWVMYIMHICYSFDPLYHGRNKEQNNWIWDYSIGFKDFKQVVLFVKLYVDKFQRQYDDGGWAEWRIISKQN